MGFFANLKPLIDNIKAQQGASVEVENDVKAAQPMPKGVIGRAVNSIRQVIDKPESQPTTTTATPKPQSILNQVMGEEEDKKPMGMKKGGAVRKTKKYSSGGSVSSASKRGDGCATKGKTKGKIY